MTDTEFTTTESSPRIAVRRWGDDWYHPVQREVPEGYIVDGFLFPHEDVLEILDYASGEVRSACPPGTDQAQ